MPACFCLPACWSVIQPRSQPCLHPYFALHHQLLASLSPLPLPVILTSIHLHSLTAGNKLFLILSNSEIVSCVWVPPLILTDTYISPARGYAFIWNHVAYVLFPAIIPRMLMAQLWWVQADVTMKRWRDIYDSPRKNTGRIKSHINSLAYQLERMFTALLQGFPEQRSAALWQNLSHLQCFMLSCTDAECFFGVGGLQHPAIDVNCLDIRKDFLLTG